MKTFTGAYPLTLHAARRAQQRAIPAEVLDLLLDYGECFGAGGGAEIVRIGQHGRDERSLNLPPAPSQTSGPPSPTYPRFTPDECANYFAACSYEPE